MQCTHTSNTHTIKYQANRSDAQTHKIWPVLLSMTAIVPGIVPLLIDDMLKNVVAL
jgi:hypothetical protein